MPGSCHAQSSAQTAGLRCDSVRRVWCRRYGLGGKHAGMLEHTTVVHRITRDRTHRGGWVEHEPTGCAVVRCTCGLDSGTVAETRAVQIADDHRRLAAEALSDGATPQ
jgi:hypothetical protein